MPSIDPLDIRLIADEDSATLRVSGEVDAATVEQFRTALLEAQRSRRVLVDLSDVTFMDSAGINALVGAYHRKPPGGELRLVSMRSNVRRVFEITGLVALFPDDPGDKSSVTAGDS